jgi:apolipoprotein N-acyltransferase
MIALLCALLSGGMFYLAEGLNNIWALGWIAPVPLLWLAYGNTPRWQLYLAGAAAFAWGQAYLFQSYGGFSIPVVLRVLVPPVLLFGAVLVFVREVRNRLPAAVTLFAFPAAWAAVEYVLGALLQDGPFSSMANAQVSFPAGLQVASLFGFPAVTFLICLFANAVALLLRRETKAGGIGLAVCAVALVFGFIRLAQPQGPSLHVVALADTAAKIKSWKAKTIDDSLAASTAYAGKVRALAATGAKIDLAVIAEGAISMHRDWQSRVLAPLAAAARATGATIVVGTAVPDPVLNRAIAFSPDGTAITYDKRHPLRPEEKEIPGTAPGLLGNGRAMAICKDMDFPASIRSDVQSGIRVMVVPASDFTRDDWIHARQAILRGVENGFAILRSAFNGVETVSDAQGRVLASTNTSRFGMITLTADLPLGPGATLYTRIGDVFAWACILASLLMAAALRRKVPEGRGGLLPSRA